MFRDIQGCIRIYGSVVGDASGGLYMDTQGGSRVLVTI